MGEILADLDECRLPDLSVSSPIDQRDSASFRGYLKNYVGVELYSSDTDLVVCTGRQLHWVEKGQKVQQTWEYPGDKRGQLKLSTAEVIVVMNNAEILFFNRRERSVEGVKRLCNPNFGRGWCKFGPAWGWRTSKCITTPWEDDDDVRWETSHYVCHPASGIVLQTGKLAQVLFRPVVSSLQKFDRKETRSVHVDQESGVRFNGVYGLQLPKQEEEIVETMLFCVRDGFMATESLKNQTLAVHLWYAS